jgi:CheY-like chemotaxis protein
MRDLLQSTIGGTVRIETALQDALWPATVDPTQIELAVLNLAINARDAMEIGGTLKVSTSNQRRGPPSRPEEPPAGEYVAVRVSDNGGGMSDDIRSKVFEPFFTTKEIGKGSGLGLSQVLGFAKQSGGGVRLESAPGKGTSVTIFLPRADPTVKKSDAALEVSVPHLDADALVLVVDDDSAVREVTCEMLRDTGYRVHEAGSGGAALEIIDSGEAFDLAIIDLAMPGMSGAELAQHVRKRVPGLPILFVTGYAEREALGQFNDAQVIRKPFVTREFADKVALALKH